MGSRLPALGVWSVRATGRGRPVLGNNEQLLFAHLVGCLQASPLSAGLRWAPRTLPPELARDGAGGSGRHSPLPTHRGMSPSPRMPPGRAFKWHFLLRVAGLCLQLTLSVREEASPGPSEAWEHQPDGKGWGRGRGANGSGTPDPLPALGLEALSRGRAKHSPGGWADWDWGHSPLGAFLLREPSPHGAQLSPATVGEPATTLDRARRFWPWRPAPLAVPEGWAVPGSGGAPGPRGPRHSHWGEARGSDWEPGCPGCEVVVGEGRSALAFFCFHFKRIHIFSTTSLAHAHVDSP